MIKYVLIKNGNFFQSFNTDGRKVIPQFTPVKDLALYFSSLKDAKQQAIRTGARVQEVAV